MLGFGLPWRANQPVARRMGGAQRYPSRCRVNMLAWWHDRVSSDWPYSSFHRMVKLGIYPENWAGDVSNGGADFGERRSAKVMGFARAQPILRADIIFGGGGSSPVGTRAPTVTDFIVSPGGTAYPIPRGAMGPAQVETGRGFQFQGGTGGLGLNEGVTAFRFMDPVTTGRYQYPNGYGVYNNVNGQTVNPFTGRTIPNADPLAHIPAQ
jgi:hypothetical protein